MSHSLNNTQYDPTWTDPRVLTPIFTLERIYNAKIFDIDGNEVPCVISYWLGENNEIQEVKVSIKDVEFWHFNSDIREILLSKHKRGEVIGEIERI